MEQLFDSGRFSDQHKSRKEYVFTFRFQKKTSLSTEVDNNLKDKLGRKQVLNRFFY